MPRSDIAVAAGPYIRQDGTIGTYAGTGSQAITALSTQVLYLDLTIAGSLTVAVELSDHSARPAGDCRRR